MMSMYFWSGGGKQSNLEVIGYPQGVEINCIPSIAQGFSLLFSESFPGITVDSLLPLFHMVTVGICNLKKP